MEYIYIQDIHFWAPLNNARSLGVSPTSIIFAPAKSCMIRPDVTIGEMPSSINVPEDSQTTSANTRPNVCTVSNSMHEILANNVEACEFFYGNEHNAKKKQAGKQTTCTLHSDCSKYKFPSVMLSKKPEYKYYDQIFLQGKFTRQQIHFSHPDLVQLQNSLVAVALMKVGHQPQAHG
jgi:hypothetical protein